MGVGAIPFFAFEATDGTVKVVQLVDWNERDKVIAQLIESGEMAKGAPIVDKPTLPDTPAYRWAIVDGQVVDDGTKRPPPNPRQPLIDQLEAAKTVDDLKALLTQVFGL